MFQRFFMLALLLIALVGLSACSSGGGEPSADAAKSGEAQAKVVILIQDYALDPAEAVVKSGGTVIWNNKDGATHHIKFENYEMENDEIRSGMEMDHTFEKPGEYEYICEIHPTNPEEHGKITVK